jgi:Holliday junction resolvasome RuvABC DNA-binding subunit
MSQRPSMLRQAVATEDTSYLTKVGGIGKKNAEKIVLELQATSLNVTQSTVEAAICTGKAM